MTTNNKGKREARALQKRTGWHYMECLRCVRNLSKPEIEQLIRERNEEDHGKDKQEGQL